MSAAHRLVEQLQSDAHEFPDIVRELGSPHLLAKAERLLLLGLSSHFIGANLLAAAAEACVAPSSTVETSASGRTVQIDATRTGDTTRVTLSGACYGLGEDESPQKALAYALQDAAERILGRQ